MAYTLSRCDTLPPIIVEKATRTDLLKVNTNRVLIVITATATTAARNVALCSTMNHARKIRAFPP